MEPIVSTHTVGVGLALAVIIGTHAGQYHRNAQQLDAESQVDRLWAGVCSGFQAGTL